MKLSSRKTVTGRIELLVATLIWGTSFVILKNALDDVPPFCVQGLRFAIAVVIIFLVVCFRGIRHLRETDRKTIVTGILMGCCLFAAEAFQTYGLMYTTPAKNAFLTTTYCVITPFLAWVFFKKRPTSFNFAAAGICVIGIGLISLTGQMTIEIGDALTLICGFFYAMHIIVIEKGRDCNVLTITLIQFAVAGALCWAASGISGETSAINMISAENWARILYMGVFCTAVCFLLQAHGQKNTPPSQAAIILILESVFGTVFSAIFYGEQFTLQMILGFILVFIAVLISETQLTFLYPVRRKSEK